ncbi:hypothetical protein [Runella zeae]|uniref:hypothetical protein n=1 Tax=Runella zeae TaxID=94255 RepID=UPI00048DCFFE|nr:hypothetical protein [Runella zeae]
MKNKNKSVLEVIFGGLHKKISEALSPEEYTELTENAATFAQDSTLEAIQATTSVGAAAPQPTTSAVAAASAPVAATTSPAPQASAEATAPPTTDPMQAVLQAVQNLTQKVDSMATKQAAYDNYFQTAQNAGVVLPQADASSRVPQALTKAATDSPMGVAAEIWKRNRPQA